LHLLQKTCASNVDATGDATFVVEDAVDIPGIQRPQIVDVDVAAISQTDDLDDVEPDDDATMPVGIDPAVSDDMDTVDTGATHYLF